MGAWEISVPSAVFFCEPKTAWVDRADSIFKNRLHLEAAEWGPLTSSPFPRVDSEMCTEALG